MMHKSKVGAKASLGPAVAKVALEDYVSQEEKEIQIYKECLQIDVWQIVVEWHLITVEEVWGQPEKRFVP